MTTSRCSLRRRASVLAALSLLLAAAACSSSGGAELASGPGGGGATTTTVPTYYPLTGLAVGDPTTANRPAITVKIENSAASRPQAGLDKADVVFEAVVEGGQTRFLAMFQSTDASQAGPVRSVRPSDPAIVTPFGGIVAYSGGIQSFVDALKATGLTNFDETSGGSAFKRRSDRPAPHNLYTSTAALYAKAPGGKPPPKFATFLKPGEAWAPAGAVPVTHVTLAVGSSTRADFSWDPSTSTWKRFTDGVPHMAEGGGQLSATTVIVQYVPYETTGSVDVTGAVVSEGKVIGSGDAVVFANGQMVKARWSKTSASSMTTWTDLSGQPLPLPAGRTWVELPAIGSSLTTT